MRNNYFSSLYLSLPLVLILSSCDFTPPLNKEILQAQQYIIQQEYEEAILKYEKILDKNPPKNIQVKINYQLGDLYSIYLSKNKKAVKYYKRIMKISDEPLWLVKTQERLGEIYFSYLKNYELSKEIYKKLSNFQPKLSKQDFYQFRYALSTFNLNDFVSSKALFRNIRRNKAHEFYVRSFYFEGLIYFQKKEWNKSVALWQKYIKLETRRDNVVQVKFLMANAYETMEKLKQAYNLYYSILGEYPNTDVVQNRLKSIYERRVARKR